MAHVSPARVIVEKTSTKDGEITINLNLSITINSEGVVGVAANVENKPIVPKEESKKEEFQYLLPDLKSLKNMEVVNFEN